jgi:dipeptidyl aminopeptidase/acylaminoacyl peptidase
MKKLYLLSIITLFLTLTACNQTVTKSNEPIPQFNNTLTDSEKAGGVMTPEIMWKFGRLGSMVISPDGKSVIYTVTQYDLPTEAKRTNLFIIPSAGGDPLQLTTEGAASPQWFDNGNKIAFVRNGSLWTMKADGTDQNEIAGFKDFEIFNISPAGDKVYFTRRVKLDQTANEKYNLPKANVRIINNLMYRHWDTWSDYSYSHIFIAKFNGLKVSDEMDIMKDQRFESPTSPDFDDREISWSPDGQSIAYTSKRLNGKEDALSTNSDIFLYSVESGKERNIALGNMGYDKYPAFSPDGTKIAYQSMERDGYEADLDRLFVYNLNDGTRSWVSEGWDYNVENLTWSDDKTLFFTCAYRGTTQLFKKVLTGKEVIKVTDGKHDLGPVSFNSNVLISKIMSISMAPEIVNIDMNSGQINQISFINKDIYGSVKMGKTEERYIKTKDNKDLQMWVIYPPDFDTSKKYPTLLYCKGGPQGPLGQDWSYRWNYQMMAAKGYIVVAPNRRGNSGFGSEWEEQISGDYGGKNMQDYLDAIDAMAKEPFVDANRLGAVGASYGGYSVFYLAGIHEGRFKALIAHAGMFDFESWYGSTEELWFPNKDFGGAYWDNPTPESYKYSPHLMVDKWTAPILIICGANDFRIPYTQSLEAFQAAQLHNVPSRLLFFEDETHFVSKPQNAIIWQKEFFEWLDTYLK